VCHFEEYTLKYLEWAERKAEEAGKYQKFKACYEECRKTKNITESVGIALEYIGLMK